MQNTDKTTKANVAPQTDTNTVTIDCVEVTNAMRETYTDRQVLAVVVDAKGNTIEIATEMKTGLSVNKYTDLIVARYKGLSLLDAIRKLQRITNYSFTVIENNLYFGESIADLNGDYTLSSYTKPITN